MALIYNNDNYYLMCYSEKHGKVVNYRVDRMTNVSLSEKPIRKQAILKTRNVTQFTNTVFKMYSGETQAITLQFNDDLLNVIYDKFGEKVAVTRINNRYCTVDVDVQVSPTFFGWIAQFGTDMKIVQPEELAKEYRQWCKEIAEES